MTNRLIYCLVIPLAIIGCASKQNILIPIDNPQLRMLSDDLIFTAIAKEKHKNLIYNGAYEGIQCKPKIENYDSFLDELNFEKYKSFNCTCYQYKVKTQQRNDLHIGSKNAYYLNTKVCYDSDKSLIETPKIEKLKSTLNQTSTKHIEITKVKSITEDEIDRNTKFGKFPALIYKTNNNELIWKAQRYFGKLNVTVYQFEIDAITGEILNTEKLPYRRSIWQWIKGTGI